MKKFWIFLFLTAFFCSCNIPKDLYSWGLYEDSYYNFYKKHSPESYAQLYSSYSAMVTVPGGVRGVVPPGIYAEYGYLLLAPETPAILIEYYSNPKNFPKKVRQTMEGTDWSQVFAPEVLRAKGLEMLQKEIELYPESATFLEPIINKFNRQ